jgi:hypothetical protein
MTWKGKVTSRDMVVGTTATGWGYYALIADDPKNRGMYVEFKRGTPAFVKIMNPRSGFGPKLFKFFRATGVFKGFKPSPRKYCGGNRNCYIPMLVVSNPKKFDGNSY